MGISIDKMYGNSIIQLKSLIKIQDDSNIEIQFKYCFQTQELKEWKKKKNDWKNIIFTYMLHKISVFKK